MIISTEGFVLKTYDLRETSKIAVLYTKNYGKISGVLKGIRKNPKKFGSSVDKFTLNDIVYYQYRASDLHLISQCDLKQHYFGIRQDYKRSLAAHYALELVDHVMPQEHKNYDVYSLLSDFLASLEHIKDVDKLIYVFQVKILVLSGFRPYIDSCVLCQKRIESSAKFSLHLGGLVCEVCYLEGVFSMMSKGAVATLLYIEKNTWDLCIRIGLTMAVRKELKYLLNNFLVYHLEKQVRSAKYLYRD